MNVDPKAERAAREQGLQDLDRRSRVLGAARAASPAMIVAAAVWAFAAHSNNHHYSANGRRGLLVSAVAALAIGASAAIVNFFAEAGDKVR